MIKFYYNGLRVDGGKLQKCWYSLNNRIDGKQGITIYKRGYEQFSGEVYEKFKVENNSEIMTDYIEGDKSFVPKEHQLYADIYEAYGKQEEHRKQIVDRRNFKIKTLEEYKKNKGVI